MRSSNVAVRYLLRLLRRFPTQGLDGELSMDKNGTRRLAEQSDVGVLSSKVERTQGGINLNGVIMRTLVLMTMSLAKYL